MNDPIRTVYLLFAAQWGENMRNWPEGAVELKSAITKHISECIQQGQKIGKKEEQEKFKTHFETFFVSCDD